MNQLKRPSDARAMALLDCLDQRYSQLVLTLPPPLDKLAVRYGTFAGRPSRELLAGLSRMNAAIACMPWLFWESFCELPDDLFLEMAYAGALFGMASVLVDHLIDGHAEVPGEEVLLHQALYERGVAGYRHIFGRDSAFWIQFDRLAAEHLNGMTLELGGRTNPDRLNADTFYALAGARIAPMLTVVAALAEALQRPGLLSTIEASVKPVIVAGQMYDDIGDWREDLQAGRITYYLTRLAPAEAWQSAELPAVEEIEQSIDTNWSDAAHLRMVINWFDQGLTAVDGLECAAWVQYISEYRAAAGQHLKMFLNCHLQRSIRRLFAGDDT